MRKLLVICTVISLVLSSQAFIISGLAVAQTPPEVTTAPATNITSNSATLNGNLTDMGNASSVQVSFEWGNSTLYGSVSDVQVRSAVGPFAINLTGLFPATTYYFRAKVTADNQTTYGSQTTFATLTPPSVVTGEPSDVQTRSAMISGNLTSLGNATSVQVSFQWGLTTAYGNETTAQVRNSTGIFSEQLDSLLPNTTYHFRAKAVGYGSSYGLDVSFTTPTPQTRAEISISDEPDADRAAVIRVSIDELRDKDTGEKVTGVSVACYQAWASYDPTGVEMLSVRGADQTFTNPVFNTDRVIGKTNFAEATIIGLQPPVSVAKLVPRLIGSTLKMYTIDVSFDLICQPDGNIIENPQPKNITFQRGDINGDGNVTIVDAMFGAQFLVGLKGYQDINLLNMASVQHDNDVDKADIVDCMYIAQYVVGARTSTLDLSSVPTPGYGVREPPTKDNHLLAQYPNVNKGNQAVLCMEAYNATNIQRILMEFDVSDIPASATITSASLQLYYSGNVANNPAGLGASVYKLARTDWTETGANWNSYNGSTNWTSAGGDYATSNPTKGYTTFPASYGWMLWNVREIVQNAVLTTGGKVELLIKFDNEIPGIDYLPTFFSREYGDSQLVPKLVVSYVQ